MNSYIARLSLRGKFTLIAIAMLIPIGVLTFIAVRLELQKLSLDKHERAGLAWAAPLITVAANLSEYRAHAIAVAGGAEQERSEMQEHNEAARAAAARLDALMAADDQEFIEASQWKQLRTRVAEALEGDGSDAKHLREGPALIADLHVRVRAVAEQSELILDPGADTFPIIDTALFDLPPGVEALANARRAMDLIAAGDTSVSVRRELAAAAATSRPHLEAAMHTLAETYAAKATRETEIPKLAQALATRLEAAFKAMDDEGRGRLDVDDLTAAALAIEPLTEELTALREQTMAEFDSLLAARARQSVRVVVVEGSLVLLCVLLAFWIQTRITRYIAGQLAAANGVFGKLAQGQFDSAIGAQPGDELGRLMTALGSMQKDLAARVEADRKAADIERARAIAGERIKQALDASSVNVVVADEQADIIYLNPAAQRLMAGAANDFHQVSTRFDAGRLVGSNLEVFYADGARQRDSIAALRQSVTSQFVVGSRTFQTIVSPIMDSDGKRIGTVIEWQERTQEVAAEKEIGSLVEAVADGKLDQRVSLTGKTGFFEVLAQGLNGLVASVSDVVSETNQLVHRANDGDLTRSMDLDGKPGLYVSIGTGVNSLVGNMANVVAQVKSMAGQVHLGAEEISKGNVNLSARTEQQASSLEETASSMEEMTSTVKQTADNAGQANQLAMAARQQAEKGGTVVSTAVTAMGAINDASKKIADIIGVIDEIAFQTNLLALNAAVEAARAGEQGRGFAVVATEVRNLAGRSATAAKEIKALIQDSVAKVDEGSRLVDESGRTLVEIVNAVKKVTDIVAEIAAASREQSAGIEQVNKAVMQMDEGTQQNAALVEEASAASQAIVEQVVTLNALVSHYQVKGDTAAPLTAARGAAKRPRPSAPKAVATRPAEPARPRTRTLAAGGGGGDSEWSEF
jgi:methyl-accepting chemotaxis protein